MRTIDSLTTFQYSTDSSAASINDIFISPLPVVHGDIPQSSLDLEIVTLASGGVGAHSRACLSEGEAEGHSRREAVSPRSSHRLLSGHDGEVDWVVVYGGRTQLNMATGAQSLTDDRFR